MLKHTHLLATVALALTGCTAPPALVIDTARPAYRKLAGDSGKSAPSKTFQINSPWQLGALQVLRGASLTLTPDGRAVFSCSVRGSAGEEEAALRIVALRADGTEVFRYPGHEHAYLKVGQGGGTTPYEIVFGFEPGSYAGIQKIEWQATALAATPAR